MPLYRQLLLYSILQNQKDLGLEFFNCLGKCFLSFTIVLDFSLISGLMLPLVILTCISGILVILPKAPETFRPQMHVHFANDWSSLKQ